MFFHPTDTVSICESHVSPEDVLGVFWTWPGEQEAAHHSKEHSAGHPQ